MELKDDFELENTRTKLRWLEESYRAHAENPAQMTQARRLTMRSLKRLMNQLTEEIVRFESRAAATSSRSSL